jgi:hypothetical protein
VNQQTSGLSAIDIFNLKSAFIAPTMWAEDGDDDEDEDNADGTGSGDGSSGGDTDGTDSGANSSDIKDPEKKRLSDEAAAARVRAKQAEKEREDLAARLKEYEDKDKSDQERAERDRDEFKSKYEASQATITDQAVRLGFYESGMAARFKNPVAARRLLDLDDVDVSDGVADVKVIKERAEALLASDPYLAADGDDDGDEQTNGQPSGRPLNTKKSKREGLDEETLRAKFPALRR